eukprot:TRINITY_DN25840_c0_g1_i1.p1 TRINITY_DN25840_c0_g1~~TRINITY_DN25840_c0_g1_i1.p1  ORF type:complete len:508 (-),score=111.23 TRINITY_DN25840_c0_g1_i1:316-1839(-)
MEAPLKTQGGKVDADYQTVSSDLPDISEVIQKLGFGRAQIQALVFGGGVWLADGAELLLIGSVTRAVNEEWGLHATERGLIVSTVFVGVLFGNLLSGSLGDQFGRKPPILISYFGVFVFSMLTVFAWDFYSMCAIRLLVGMSFGIGQPSWNAMGSEICPADYRMHMTAGSQILFAVGEMYSATLIWSEDPRMERLNWRWLILMGAVPSIIFLIFSWKALHESPIWLATHGNKEDAKEVLTQLRDLNGCDASTSLDFKMSPPKKSGAYAGADRLAAVFSPSMLYTTVVVAFSCFTLNFLFYGGLYAYPQILPEFETGLSPAASLLLGAFMEIPGFLGGLYLGIWMTRKCGIFVYLVGAFISSIIFALAATQGLGHHGRIPMYLEAMLQVGLAGNKAFTAVGFVIVYCYSTEVYSTRTRATGTAVCISMGRLGSMFCPLVYEWMTEYTGTPVTFIYAMAGCVAVNAVLAFFLTKETAGMLLKDDDDDVQAAKDPEASPPASSPLVASGH